MNKKVIVYLLGQVLKIEAALMILPIIMAIIFGEVEGLSFFIVSVLCFVIGFIFTVKKPTNFTFYLKEGCITTALSWILLSIFGALPFVLNGDIPNFTNALFETVSGFTTTGASILDDVEALSNCSTLWRSFTHWIGGMGVLVFLLAIIPLSGGSNINLMRAESPGPSVGKLVPKIKYTAQLLYIIYFALTVVEIVLLLLGGAPFIDAINTSFGTAGTGGFGIKNDSIGGYNAYIQWVVTIFMILFGVNFNAYYFILLKKWKKTLAMEEIRWYFIIIITSVTIICTQTYTKASGFFTTLRHSSFQVASIMTTTGFSTVDFDQWNQTAKTVLVMLMFIGACAGSTGGGIKVSRFIITVKTIFKELHSYIHPKSIKKINIDSKPIEHDVLRSTNVYFITFIMMFSLSVFLISFEGKDLTTNFTAIAATINNIGPGLNMVGPTKNFAHFSAFSKYVMMFDMLLGRLELFPMLILFHPSVIKELFFSGKHKKTI